MLTDVLRGMMTETDNRTHDLFRYIAVVSAVVGLALQVHVVVWKSQAFDFQQFGIGVGVLFAGIGAALAMKPEVKEHTQKTENTTNVNVTTTPAA